MKPYLHPTMLLRSALATMFLMGSASAHPGHPGHDINPSAAANFLLSMPGLGQISLAAVVSGLALFCCRGVFRKLP